MVSKLDVRLAAVASIAGEDRRSVAKRLALLALLALGIAAHAGGFLS